MQNGIIVRADIVSGIVFGGVEEEKEGETVVAFKAKGRAL
jgi:hypothetical protein